MKRTKTEEGSRLASLLVGSLQVTDVKGFFFYFHIFTFSLLMILVWCISEIRKRRFVTSEMKCLVYKFINVDEVIFEKLFHLKGVLLANSCLNSMFQWEFKSDTALWLSARHASWLPDLYDLCDLYVWYLFVTYQYKRHNWVICIYVQRLSSV